MVFEDSSEGLGAGQGSETISDPTIPTLRQVLWKITSKS